MDARTLAYLQSIGRIALGSGLAVAPGLVAGPWVGAVADRPGGRALASAMGARDVALGLGTLRAVAQRRGARPWVRAGMLADAADFAVTFRVRRSLPPVAAPLVCVMAGGSVLLGAWLQASVD